MRTLLLALALASAAALGCKEKSEVIEPSGPPPLPPASGTAVGYLVDAAGDLKLSDDQVTKLKQIDSSLAARNGDIDAQLRQAEQPEEAEQISPQQMKAGVKEKRYDNAPGKSTVKTADTQKLHKIRDDNERDALNKALAVLDPQQQEKAKRILQDRGVTLPGEKQQPQQSGSDDGTPLPGMEP